MRIDIPQTAVTHRIFIEITTTFATIGVGPAMPAGLPFFVGVVFWRAPTAMIWRWRPDSSYRGHGPQLPREDDRCAR